MNTRWSGAVGAVGIYLSVADSFNIKCAESFDLVPKPSNNELFFFKLNNLTNEMAKQMWINHHQKCDAIVLIVSEKRMLKGRGKRAIQKPIYEEFLFLAFRQPNSMTTQLF